MKLRRCFGNDDEAPVIARERPNFKAGRYLNIEAEAEHFMYETISKEMPSSSPNKSRPSKLGAALKLPRHRESSAADEEL